MPGHACKDEMEKFQQMAGDLPTISGLVLIDAYRCEKRNNTDLYLRRARVRITDVVFGLLAGH